MHIYSGIKGGAGYEEQCLSYPASLPEVFGPGIWWVLHTTASVYPNNPEESKRAECEQFVNSLPSMIPCTACARHCREEMSKQDIAKACSSGDELSNFWCSVHNAVNARLDKPLMDCASAREEYSTVPVCGVSPRYMQGSRGSHQV